jgi:hypothetical protein
MHCKGLKIRSGRGEYLYLAISESCLLPALTLIQPLNFEITARWDCVYSIDCDVFSRFVSDPCQLFGVCNVNVARLEQSQRTVGALNLCSVLCISSIRYVFLVIRSIRLARKSEIIA